MTSGITRLVRHAGVYLLGNILSRVGAFLLLPLYTTHLTTADYGRLELLYVVTALASVVWSAGLAHTTLRFYFDEKEESGRHVVVVTNLALSAFLGTVGAGALALFADPIAELVLDDIAYSSAIRLCLVIMVFEMTSEVGFAYVRARERSVLYVQLSVLKLVAQVGFSVYLVAYAGRGLFGVLTANLVAVVLVWLIVIGFVLRNCGFRVGFARIPEMLRYSIPFGFSGVLVAVMGSADRFLIKEMASLADVGIYAVAVKFAMIMMLVVAEPFYRSYGPFRFSIIEQANAKALQSLVAEQIFAAGLAVGLGLAMFTPELLRLMASAEFHASAIYVPLLVMALAVGILGYCFETGVLYRKKTGYILAVRLVDVTVKIGLNLLLIPALGVLGAAVAALCTAVVSASLMNAFSQRLYRVEYRYGAMITMAIGAALLMVVSLALEGRSLWVSVPAKMALLAVFLSGLIATNRRTRELLSSLVRKATAAAGIFPGRGTRP